MKIICSELWREPYIVASILTNCLTLDPTVFIGNPKIYLLLKDGKVASFLALKSYKKGWEIKSVYTFQNYRGKKHMTRLIQFVLKKYHSPYLICKKSLLPFYSKFGFKESANAPYFLKIEKFIFNAVFGIISKNPLVILRRKNG
ncbi:MAG TPA: GNAT family N-acetyltransferase [Candidatus Nanoarchaeia archaeon]|nr:GNAT family N-acetyltransferase [Candidatus Nanoarchaeia archaeon]